MAVPTLCRVWRLREVSATSWGPGWERAETTVRSTVCELFFGKVKWPELDGLLRGVSLFVVGGLQKQW